MTFIEETLEQNSEIWKGYLQHPFLNDIRNNQMNKVMFKHYLIEDTKYLKAYAKVFALGIYKSETMQEMRLFYDLLSVVDSSESTPRVSMLKEMGCDVEAIENQQPTSENQEYMEFLYRVGEEEGIVEILFATLPCMLSYAYIGKELVKENPLIVVENTYREWILEYVEEAYVAKCEEWAIQAEAMSAEYTMEQKQHLQVLFKEASIHEMKFWDMSYRK